MPRVPRVRAKQLLLRPLEVIELNGIELSRVVINSNMGVLGFLVAFFPLVVVVGAHRYSNSIFSLKIAKFLSKNYQLHNQHCHLASQSNVFKSNITNIY